MACKSCKCKSTKLGPLPENTVGAHWRRMEQKERISEALKKVVKDLKAKKQKN